jgi:hypothetical protein
MTYRVGLTHDRENEDLRNGVRCALDELNKRPDSGETEARVARMAADPELWAILSDPVILQLISNCSSNFAAAAEHLKDAGVSAAKVQKIVDSGILELS